MSEGLHAVVLLLERKNTPTTWGEMAFKEPHLGDEAYREDSYPIHSIPRGRMVLLQRLFRGEGMPTQAVMTKVSQIKQMDFNLEPASDYLRYGVGVPQHVIPTIQTVG